MHTHDTQTHADESLPEGKEVDPVIKDVIDALFALWGCEDRVRALQEEIRRHPDFNGDDRHFLDLSA